MLNTAIEQLDLLIKRLEMMFQVQTHEVVQDLKKIKEELNNTGNIPKTKKEKEIEEVKIEITEEQSEPKTCEEITESKEEIKEEVKQTEATPLEHKQMLYKEKFGKEVPPRFKNDIEWIDKKLAE